jgi:hypothetical protein
MLGGWPTACQSNVSCELRNLQVSARQLEPHVAVHPGQHRIRPSRARPRQGTLNPITAGVHSSVYLEPESRVGGRRTRCSDDVGSVDSGRQVTGSRTPGHPVNRVSQALSTECQKPSHTSLNRPDTALSKSKAPDATISTSPVVFKQAITYWEGE